MTHLIVNPSPEDKRKWGPLAHVTPEERSRILNLPLGQRKQALANLDREIKAALKKRSGR